MSVNSASDYWTFSFWFCYYELMSLVSVLRCLKGRFSVVVSLKRHRHGLHLGLEKGSLVSLLQNISTQSRKTKQTYYSYKFTVK